MSFERTPNIWARTGALALTVLAPACSKSAPSDGTGSAATSLAASATKAPNAKSAKATEIPRDASLIDFLSTSDCTFGHRGALIDLGDPSTEAKVSGGKLVKGDLDIREREGASWVGIRNRSLETTFVSAAEVKSDSGIVVEARVRGGAAKSAAVYLNGKPVGTLSLTKGETTIATARTTSATILRGTNELLLRFNGGGRNQHDQLAEVDWIRVGPNDGDAPYSAPTRGDAITNVTIAGATRRSVSLRAPGYARCSTFIPSGSFLEGFVGGAGGEGEAEVRVLVDRSEPRVVGSFHFGGPTDPPGWRPISLPLGDLNTIAGVELVAKSSSKGARVAFAEARVVPPPEPQKPAASPVTAARGVIVVAMGSTSRRISPYGGTIVMPALASLASSGVVFENHRATSSYASGALGSMLTGLLPREHGASDADAVLSPKVFTIAEAARQAGVVTAMFTANPTTTAPYGFSRGWETFGAHLPGEEGGATTVFDDAAKWLEAHKSDRFLLVIHARGGHPPWDVTSEELGELPPKGYVGSLEPKSAGEALAKARKGGGGRSFADPDRERAFALHAKALAAQDAALGKLVSRVRSLGRDGDTVWIVSGDVGVDAAARVPFLEDDSLEEGALGIPLVVRGIGERPRERVAAATSGVDVATTVLESLGLSAPPALRGESLWMLTSKGTLAVERPLFAATTTRFSARWGTFAVVGARERELKVCNLSLDPDCVSDVRPSHPLAAEALHALAYRELVVKASAKATDTARAAVDGPTSAALRIWGR